MNSIEDLLSKKSGAAPQQSQSGKEGSEEKLKEKMEEIRLKEAEAQVKAAAASSSLPYFDLTGFPIPPEALSSVPETQARELRAVCFFNSWAEIRVGAVDPKLAGINELVYQLEERFHGKTRLYMVSAHSLEKALALYAALPKIKPIVKGVEITEDEITSFNTTFQTFKDVHPAIQKATTSDIVSMVVAGALKFGASDIHIEAEEAVVKFRYRLDGVLHDIATLPKENWPQMISRIKLLAGLKINVVERPQDGRFTIFLSSGKTEVRVSTIPTGFGESVVMRLLRSTVKGADFEGLGFRGRAAEELRKQIEKPNGMIITTGPTGSGKTTTLYAILSKLNSPDVKIITLEDPIEYRLAGINQSQIDHSKDYTFANGLRSILRQDPDVVMVGEIRDLETAEIAIQAALTGHLVLSTIHTNDAAGAIPRFLSMGVKPFLLAPALNAIIAQRLVRKICEKCKVEDVLDSETLKRVKEALSDLPKDAGVKVDLGAIRFWKSPGCDACGGLGYKGRMGIYEVLLMTKEIEKVILSGAVSEYQMRDIAKAAGMVTMAQDGLIKAVEGITTVEEVFSVAD